MYIYSVGIYSVDIMSFCWYSVHNFKDKTTTSLTSSLRNFWRTSKTSFVMESLGYQEGDRVLRSLSQTFSITSSRRRLLTPVLGVFDSIESLSSLLPDDFQSIPGFSGHRNFLPWSTSYRNGWDRRDNHTNWVRTEVFIKQSLFCFVYISYNGNLLFV